MSGMDRLFVAAWPDDATTAMLSLLARPEERGFRWVSPDHWHVTLRFLGTCDTATVMRRLDAATLPAAHARLGPAVEWLGPQLVVPVSGVDDLATAVHAATEGIGQPARRDFRGHLTIARTRRGASSSLIGHPVDGGFDVPAVALVRSDLTHHGARYSTVATYPTG